MWSLIVTTEKFVGLFDGVETDLEKEVKINTKKVCWFILTELQNSWINDVKILVKIKRL